MNRSETLKAAEQCVCGDREEDYGNPENNFSNIADGFTWYLTSAYPALKKPLKEIGGLKSLDIAMMLAVMKVARVAGGRVKSDNFVDLAGYAACGAEIASGSQMEKIVGIGDGLYVGDDNVVRVVSE